MSKNIVVQQVGTEVAERQTEFAERSPLLRGIDVSVNGRKVIMPSALMIHALDLAEATEKLTIGEITPSAYLRARNLVVEETLKRNYPSLTRRWFEELDASDYLRLARAATEAAGLGEEVAANL